MEQFMSVWRNYMKNYMSSETLENAELLPKIMQMENFQRWNDDLTLPQVLCHGDFTPPNIMFEKDTRTFKSICDYQTSNIGNGMQDLARLLATSLSGQNRRKHTENLLKVYHEEIQKHISYQIDFEKIIESYEIFFVLHSAVCCSTSPGSILRRLNESTDEQFKQQISDVMWEKYTLLLEDMAIYWNYHF
ncbi:unnamed protein product [Caenorhabditis angaria]|uniref:CHK kinase-like domain-containing protein n=1 Tax=Caenorhabditis angaria TaxID=860376 RepID=A0A9P1IW01_9PELO|nr:unnamed protein product [Caenorhabditis angaria]